MAIYKIEFNNTTTVKWGYWIEGEESTVSGMNPSYWLVCYDEKYDRPTVRTWQFDIGKYQERYATSIHCITRLDNITLGGLFQQLHDITEEEGPA